MGTFSTYSLSGRILFSFSISQLHGSKRKTFTKATTYQPFCPDKASGALSLKDYQSQVELNQRLQKLRDVGLTQEEIQFKLEQEGLLSKANILIYAYLIQTEF